IRAVDPTARFVHADPLIHLVPPADTPRLAAEVEQFNAEVVFEAWQMLAGRKEPELGGSGSGTPRRGTAWCSREPRRVPGAPTFRDRNRKTRRIPDGSLALSFTHRPPYGPDHGLRRSLACARGWGQPLLPSLARA